MQKFLIINIFCQSVAIPWRALQFGNIPGDSLLRKVVRNRFLGWLKT